LLTQTSLVRAEQLHHLQLARFVNPYAPNSVSVCHTLASRLAHDAPGPVT